MTLTSGLFPRLTSGLSPRLAVLLQLAVASAWWPEPHMLTGEIARQRLSASEASLLDALLAESAAAFPETSDLTTAPVWMDVLKCAGPGFRCNTTRPSAITAFSAWHYANLPYNPDAVALTAEQLEGWREQPSAPWALAQAVFTLARSQSRWAMNFMLRMLLHAAGDLHQPLHAVALYTGANSSASEQWGLHPDGDRGGNAERIEYTADELSTDLLEVHRLRNLTTLHAFWDSGGALYVADVFPLSADARGRLQQEAARLTALYPPGAAAFAGRYDGGAASEACWDEARQAASHGSLSSCPFAAWVEESHDVAVAKAYAGFVVGEPLSEAYVAQAQAVAEQQIALAGYRLADALRLVAARLAALPASAAAASGGGSAPVCSEELPPGIVALIAVLAAALALALGAIALLVRRERLGSPCFAHVRKRAAIADLVAEISTMSGSMTGAEMAHSMAYSPKLAAGASAEPGPGHAASMEDISLGAASALPPSNALDWVTGSPAGHAASHRVTQSSHTRGSAAAPRGGGGDSVSSSVI